MVFRKAKHIHIEKHKYKLFYQNLTDTDSTSLFSIFICDLNCQLNEKDSRNVIFEVMVCSKIVDRSNLSDKFCEQIRVCDSTLIKQAGLYERESIDNVNIETVAVNPK